MEMQPHYKSLLVGLVPQPLEVPPPPFDQDALQRVFADVIRKFPYQSFEFLFGGRGAQFTAGPEDVVELRPALLQIVAKMDGMEVLTAEMAEKKATWILKTAVEGLEVPGFLQCEIAVIATVEAPGGDARAFVEERMMHGGDQAAELGPGYVGAGVVFKGATPGSNGENVLSVEPLFQDNNFVFLKHQVRLAVTEQPVFLLDQVSDLVSGAFDFLSGPTMRLLNR